MPGLADLNALPAPDFEQLLLRCCAAPGWARQVTAGRPYASLADLLAAADAAWAARDPGDLDAAMAGHPRIGDRVTGTSATEQSGVTDASRGALVAGNVAYEERFGHVFLICASGLSGEQMLAALRERLSHDPGPERAVAAHELLKITVLRARKLASP